LKSTISKKVFLTTSQTATLINIPPSITEVNFFFEVLSSQII
jgi:hypothetical protein